MGKKIFTILDCQFLFILTCELTLFQGAGINHQDWTGSTPLYDAVKNGHIGVVKTLIEHGADVNLPTTKGISPLLGLSYPISSYHKQIFD